MVQHQHQGPPSTSAWSRPSTFVAPWNCEAVGHNSSNGYDMKNGYQGQTYNENENPRFAAGDAMMTGSGDPMATSPLMEKPVMARAPRTANWWAPGN